MTKQEQIEELGQDIYDNCPELCENGCGGKPCYKCIAESLQHDGYRKLPENSVVLSREDIKKYVKDCIAGEETGLDIINALIARAERYKEKAKQERKETAEKILKDFKLWAREYQYKDTVVDENGERPMTNNEKLNYLYTYLCDKYKVEIKE